MKHGCNLALCKAKQVKFGIFWPPTSCIYYKIHSRSFYGLRPVSKSLHGQPPVLGNTRYSKLTAALHGFPAIARLSCSTCFVLSIGNKHSNEINCHRVDRLVSPTWFVADLTVAEMACRRDDWWPLRRWKLWWGDACRMRWIRQRVNGIRLTEWRSKLIPTGKVVYI